jgi:hypothetical protein
VRAREKGRKEEINPNPEKEKGRRGKAGMENSRATGKGREWGGQ